VINISEDITFFPDDIIFLLGAGASAPAGIMISDQMIQELKNIVETEKKEYKELFYYIYSSIIYSDQIQGNMTTKINIERFFHTINEIERKEKNELFPFIGSWNVKFQELIEDRYDELSKFKDFIQYNLKEWLSIKHSTDTKYNQGFFSFQQQLTHPLRIFTLNYDTCIEENMGSFSIELGFDPDTHRWDYRRFDSENDPEANIFLYKLHGSINWMDDENGITKKYDSIQRSPAIIFGTYNKINPGDPYLFLIHEFRKYCFKAKLLVIIGYSFGDDHINSIINQALLVNSELKLVIVSRNASKNERFANHTSKIKKIDEGADSYKSNLKINKLWEIYKELTKNE
jgi:hypothetical protein